MKKRANSRLAVQNDILDLSMSELTEVPIKDIALYPKINRIDLSSNLISNINPAFCNNFRQIIELDLSQNELQTLPENFGNLANLTKLELYNNQLSSLPVSMSKLSKLKYLDLKNNRFPQSLLTIIGECSEARDCQQCAKQVVAYMSQAQKRLDEEAIQRKKAEAELNARRQESLRKEQEAEQSRKKKKLEKDKRNAERLETLRQNQSASAGNAVTSTTVTANVVMRRETVTPVALQNSKQTTSGTSSKFPKVLLILLSTILFGLLIFGGLLYLYTGGDFSKRKIDSAMEVMKVDFLNIAEIVWRFTKSTFTSLNRGCEKVWHFLNHNAIPYSKWFWKLCKLAAADFNEIASNSISHMIKATGVLLRLLK